MSKSANINDLENKKISSLIWKYALPAIVGTIVNALYNIIDRIYIGHTPGLGDHAIGGLGIALPIMALTAAVGMLVGAGSASRISIFLGRGDKETAEKIIGTSFFLTLLLSFIVYPTLFIFLEPILWMLEATEETFPYAYEFMSYLLIGNIFITICFNFNSMMRASGYPTKAMYTMLISVVANILLAPLFLFVFKMGIRGAAIATVISMFIGLCFVMHHFMNSSSRLRLRIKHIKPYPKIIWAILSIGLSPFFIQLAASIVVFFINKRLSYFGGNVGIEAFAIANTLVMIIIMILIGLTQGMQPIVGYNYGARNYSRVKEALNYTIKVGIAIGAVGLILVYIFPQLFVEPFNPSPALAEETAKALRIITIMLPLVGFQIVVTNFFQCIGQAGKSIFLSLTRQLLFLVPALLILPSIFGLNGIWYALPAADFLATVLTAVLFVIQIRHLNKMTLHTSPL